MVCYHPQSFLLQQGEEARGQLLHAVMSLLFVFNVYFSVYIEELNHDILEKHMI